MFNIDQLDGLNAEQIYYQVKDKIKELSGEEIHRICDLIKRSPGDRAYAIYRGVSELWWDTKDNNSISNDVYNAPGKKLITIRNLIFSGIWTIDDELTIKLANDNAGNDSELDKSRLLEYIRYNSEVDEK